MFQVELLFFMQAIMTAFIIVLVYRLSQMKKKMDKIINEVQEYINFITEESVEDVSNTAPNFYEEKKFSQMPQRKTNRKELQEEAQTRLIQAVLGEYFP